MTVLALAPVRGLARPWKGITPGQSTQADVVEKFGEPSTKAKRGARVVLAYAGEQALEGTKQAQFHVDGDGTVQEITVFITEPLDAETIEGTYGKPPQKTFVEDTFQKVWIYPQQGVTVYFAKEGHVAALSYTAGTRPRKTAAAEPGHAAAAAPAAAADPADRTTPQPAAR
ncbi:hypothetical protein AMOR_49450 [Anaeromyxobacter oryzae]|uniref:Lipoprotein n=1 Tax=Anaeromyxobacter oryzae TaxID=2918170 RepID=A0ABN6MYA3_9BACT|nr:hypothetical protein AMOR_49450 [Anaeromyxobacter oryzae]